MPVLVPVTVDEAMTALSRHPDGQLLAGGTDFMVEVNAGGRRPDSVVALDRVAELRDWSASGTRLKLGAGVTYRDLMLPELARLVPALAMAARTVGSPQIRNTGTIGGNVATASPAGDTLPVLIALDATVEVVGTDKRRRVALADLIVGPKRTTLQTGELIASVEVPILRGGQEYLKVGVRNAMVIAVASLALIADLDGRTVRCGLGSVGPVPLRAPEAEAWLAGQVDWGAGRITDATASQFGEMVAEAVRPIDDHRSTAAYRRRAVEVMAQRAAARIFSRA
ncbi:MAG TPA: xanthine dehydrogenase family protein subunit M [Acidimicrobiales bacterium]|nr:xanthine dehydrogenase family protein subunit M [Acidimicrobiales bacterium]